MVEFRRVARALLSRDQRRIGFMHIPRTSGTTLVREIGRRMGIGRSAYVFDPVLFGDFAEFDSFQSRQRRMIRLDARRLPRRAAFLAGHLSRASLQASGRNAAIAALDRFAFADVLENTSLQANLEGWLGMSLRYERRNQTRPLAPERMTSLGREMDLLTCSLMAQRCRLDAALWSHLANRRLGAAASSVRAQAEQAGLRRCALLLTGVASESDSHRHAA